MLVAVVVARPLAEHRVQADQAAAVPEIKPRRALTVPQIPAEGVAETWTAQIEAETAVLASSSLRSRGNDGTLR